MLLAIWDLTRSWFSVVFISFKVVSYNCAYLVWCSWQWQKHLRFIYLILWTRIYSITDVMAFHCFSLVIFRGSTCTFEMRISTGRILRKLITVFLKFHNKFLRDGSRNQCTNVAEYYDPLFSKSDENCRSAFTDSFHAADSLRYVPPVQYVNW